MGTLIKGLGHEHVFWGTDSVWPNFNSRSLVSPVAEP